MSEVCGLTVSGRVVGSRAIKGKNGTFYRMDIYADGQLLRVFGTELCDNFDRVPVRPGSDRYGPLFWVRDNG